MDRDYEGPQDPDERRAIWEERMAAVENPEGRFAGKCSQAWVRDWLLRVREGEQAAGLMS